jgi:ubiquinol-cytochrome c reductase cytochrome c subunit
MKYLIGFTVMAALLHTPFALAADPAAPAGSAERGKQLFMKNTCFSCHGTVGQGGERGAGPKIAPNPFPYAAFASQVRQPRAVMPRYTAEFVSDQDLADIYAYVASVPAGPAAKDIPLLK